jgi:2-oxoglutarate dehydrogenase E1 component
MLSEYAVLGFEYGYSLSEPNAARDVGGAVRRLRQRRADHVRPVHHVGRIQVAADVRPRHAPAPRLRGPGPEHSSARLERFLQMCGQDNWIVANCTTPANYFHILRRQIHRSFRKPLVLMTPKSLLRHKLAVSTAEMTTGSSFHRVLWDDAERGNSQLQLKADSEIRRVVLCSARSTTTSSRSGTRGLRRRLPPAGGAVLPVPGPEPRQGAVALQGAQMVWCQEEPKNQGAWTFIEPNIEWVLSRIEATHKRPAMWAAPPRRAPRRASPPSHKAQQQALVDEALTVEGKLKEWPSKSASPPWARASPRRPSPPGSRSRATASPPTRCSASSRPTR